MKAWQWNPNKRHPQEFRLKKLKIWGDADKSLARPGRKHTTTAKLGIYSTYSPRSSIHFLACCSNFCKTLKKNQKSLPVQPGLRGRNDFRVWRKMAAFQLFFLVQRTGGSPMGPNPENRVGDQNTGSSDRPVSSGLKVLGEPGFCRARTRHPWWNSAAVFLQNVLQLHQQRWVILRVDSFAL